MLLSWIKMMCWFVEDTDWMVKLCGCLNIQFMLVAVCMFQRQAAGWRDRKWLRYLLCLPHMPACCSCVCVWSGSRLLPDQTQSCTSVHSISKSHYILVYFAKCGRLKNTHFAKCFVWVWNTVSCSGRTMFQNKLLRKFCDLARMKQCVIQDSEQCVACTGHPMFQGHWTDRRRDRQNTWLGQGRWGMHTAF
jgi:hypothetical protein